MKTRLLTFLAALFVGFCSCLTTQATVVVSDDGKTLDITVDDMLLTDHTYLPYGYGWWQMITSNSLQDDIVINLSASNTDHLLGTYTNSQMDKDYTFIHYYSTKKTVNFKSLNMTVTSIDFRTFRFVGSAVTTEGVTVNFNLIAGDEEVAPREDPIVEEESQPVVRVYKGTNEDGTAKVVAEVAAADSITFYETEGAHAKTGYAATKDGNVQEWVQLWEGGPKWAQFNVGSSILSYVKAGTNLSYYGIVNKAAVGGSYTWGGHKDLDNATYNETLGENATLTGDDDTATYLWGDNWRMPTYDELTELWNNGLTTWQWYDGYWTKYKDCIIAGFQVNGVGEYANQEIFLPAAGFSLENALNAYNGYGFYWSSTSTDAVNAYCRYFYNPERGEYGYFRGGGCSVRAVLK